MHRHVDSFMPLEGLGTSWPAYRPTFDFEGPYINAFHASLADPAPDDACILLRSRRDPQVVIDGWLRPADALKLYELAYYTQGDILELGCYHGLSTAILAQAVRDTSPRFFGRRKSIVSVDLDPECIQITHENLRRDGWRKYVKLVCNEATSAVDQLALDGRHFGFVFIDHAHSYDPVYSVCCELARVVSPGGLCLFHDFNDFRNALPNQQEYAVYQAVVAGLDPQSFEFYGVYGCTALYRATGR